MHSGSPFIKWSSFEDNGISSDGKHTIFFDENFPLNIHLHSFSYNHRLTPNYHDYLEVDYVYSGEGTLYTESEKYSLNKGDVLVIGDTEFHRVEAKNPRPLQIIDLFFLPQLVYSVGQISCDFEYLRPFYDRSPGISRRIQSSEIDSEQVLGLITRMFELKNRKSDYYQLEVKNCLTQLLLLLIRHYRKKSPDMIGYARRRCDIERLRDVFAYIRERYRERVSLEQVAGVACMSSSYFCKFFKRVTGNTLTEFIFRLRVDQAKELLIGGNMSITEIAYETGFENHSYFDRIFRRLTGVSPMHYRKKMLNG